MSQLCEVPYIIRKLYVREHDKHFISRYGSILLSMGHESSIFHNKMGLKASLGIHSSVEILTSGTPRADNLKRAQTALLLLRNFH